MSRYRTDISRRQFISTLSASTVAIGLAGCGVREEERPDIVVLVLDSLRAKSLPFHGHTRNTAPFLAGLAARSLVFSRCYAAATWTRPAVTSLLSGLPPLAHQGWRFNKAFPENRSTLARPLADGGYRTGFFTANPAIGESYGLEGQFDHVSYEAARDHDLGSRVTDECLDWASGADANRPAFVYIHFWPPHGPYLPPDEILDRPDFHAAPVVDHLPHSSRFGARLSLGDSVIGRIPWYQAKASLQTDLADYLRRYEANIAYADSLADDFFRRWQALPRRRRTIFIVTSDHGEALGEHGLMCDHGKLLIDEILHVPLLVHDTVRRRPSVVNEVVSHLDIAPTVLVMAGLSGDFGMLNSPLVDAAPPNRIVVSQEGASRGESGWALTSGRWRLVYNGGSRFGGALLMATEYQSVVEGPTTFVPTAPGRSSIRWPVVLAPDVTLESLALARAVLDGGAAVKLAGTLRGPAGEGRLALRASIGEENVELGEFSPGDFEGTVPPLPLPPDGGRLRIEGVWRNGHGDSRPWATLLSLSCIAPVRLTDALQLAALDATPTAVVRGQTVRLTPVWRVLGNVDRGVGVLWRLVDRAGRVAVQEVTSFFRPLPDPEAKPRPLIDPWRLEERTFEKRQLLADDCLWLTVPPDLEPGTYDLEVGVVDYPLYFNQGRLSIAKTPTTCASLEISDSQRDRLVACATRDLGPEDLPAAGVDRSTVDVRDALELLATRHPGQGQLDFFLAKTESGAEGRRSLLESCLAKVPSHLEANRELAILGDEESAERVARLTPEHELAVSFNDVVGLVGYDLRRHSDQLFLTLYWQAMISSRYLLSAAAFAEAETVTGGSARCSLWWFLGGARRPSFSWLAGEVVKDTVLLPLEPGSTRLRIKLNLEERWRRFYSNNRGSFNVTSGNKDERHIVVADLGVHEVSEISTAGADFLTGKRNDVSQFMLFDLESDPHQRTNLVAERPDVLASLRHELDQLIAASPAWSDDLSQDETELSEETRKQLEALGYVE